ncbi:MAG: FtsQ-type POTRA domain-containing protein [Thermoanaerobaculia bacterium]
MNGTVGMNDRFMRPLDLDSTRRNHRMLRTRRLLVIAANGVFIVLLALAGAWLYQRTQEDTRFAIRRVEITGVQNVQASEVRAIAAKYIGANLFRLEIASMRSEITRLPWVERVAIEKKLPDTVTVQIFERQPRAIVIDRGTPKYVDGSGVVFAEVTPRVGDHELPLVTGAAGAELEKAVTFLETLRSSAPALYSRVSEVSPVAAGGWMVFDRDLGTRVYLEGADAIGKWNALYGIAQAEGFAAGSIEYADLRFDRRVVIRPRHVAPLAADPRSTAGISITN